MLSLAKIGRGREDYHLRAVGADASEYYSERGEVAGRWLGGGAEALDLRGEVRDQALLSVLAGYEPGAWPEGAGWLAQPLVSPRLRETGINAREGAQEIARAERDLRTPSVSRRRDAADVRLEVWVGQPQAANSRAPKRESARHSNARRQGLCSLASGSGVRREPDGR